MPSGEFDDEYVANLLKEDARSSSARHDALGVGQHKRQNSQAPKPNIRFLKTILRETGTHNAALKAKEDEESRARLRALRRDQTTASILRDRESEHPDRHRSSERKRHERDGDRYDQSRRQRTRDRRTFQRGQEDGHQDRCSSKSRDSDERRKRKRSGDSDGEEKRKESRYHKREYDDYDKRRHHRDHHDRKKHSRRSPSPERRTHQAERSAGHKRERRHRQRSHSYERSHSPSIRRYRHHKSRNNHYSRSPLRYRSYDDTANAPQTLSRDSSSHVSDSDPLEAIVGPMPPPPEPKVRSKGRGTHKATSSMDAHFAQNYDPSADVHLGSDVEDDWDQALEALRDRQKWQRQGADRMRAAGFTDVEIQRWEKGGEKTEHDVRWAKKGEGREWDRGKVLDNTGDISLKPEWGRLKGT